MLKTIQEYRERLYRELRMYGPKDMFNKGFFLAKADKVAKEMSETLAPTTVKEKSDAETEVVKKIFEEIDELVAQHSRGDIDDDSFYRAIKDLKSKHKKNAK
jgi:hypothetical protein